MLYCRSAPPTLFRSAGGTDFAFAYKPAFSSFFLHTFKDLSAGWKVEKQNNPPDYLSVSPQLSLRDDMV